MEANNQNNQNYNIAMQNQMNNLIFNGMLQNPMNNNFMYNEMMLNQINNNFMNNGMIQTPLNNNNFMYNGMMQNQNQMNNPIFNRMIQNPMNNNFIYNGNLQNQMNNQIYSETPFNARMTNPNYLNNIINEENKPINGSIKLDIDNNKRIQYYLYPIIVFTEEELNNSKVLLLIGRTGHGKTTFMNALVNIYSGITFNDKFRYLLVINENQKQTKSITKEITIYKIRSKQSLNYPPLIIIDTPGFGDTEGEKEDKMNLIKFKEFFDSKKIKYINCILYIIIGADPRFGENDKNIINYLLNLFSKNVKDNFVVGVTNCFPDSKNDIPNIITSLADESHYYYQNVLKSDNISRDKVLKSFWYFTSENKIISNNMIEGNQREKEKYDYTVNQIKYFIENKIKILDKKNIEDSKNVLNNRFQLENEINSFTEKIDVLIIKKIVFEANINEQINYRNLITAIRDKLDKNKLEIKNISQTLKEINNTLPYMKKIINKQIKTKNENLICEECQSNCHKNCNCNLTILSNWFCIMISPIGACKICNHCRASHKIEKFIYIQKEENERLINNDTEELENYIKFLKDKKRDELYHMDAINNDNILLNKALINFNNQIKNCDKEINKAKIQNLSIENEIIVTLKNIQMNLDFLRENALNKENRTIKSFVKDYAKNKNDKEKKIIQNLFKNYES